MKKIVMLILITIMTTFGCTRIPASVETGVMPGEYEGLINTDELTKDNESLSKDLKETKEQLEKLKEDYLSLAKNNDIILERLDLAESLLNVFQNGELPKFTIENTDKIDISNYLNDQKGVLDKSYKGIEIISLESNENIVLFKTIGYGENYNQLFVWEIGKNEPVMIDGAHYDKDGNWKWLLQDKYIIINSTNIPKSEKIIVDIEKMKVINKLQFSSDDVYLIPGTSSIIMEKAKDDSSSFVIFDFLVSEEKELTFDFQNKNLKFETDNDNKKIKFTGTYKDNNETEYSVQAIMSVERLKENYGIKAIEESTEQNNSIDEPERLAGESFNE